MNTLRIRTTALVFVALLALVMTLAAPTNVSAQGPKGNTGAASGSGATLTFVRGNATCSDLAPSGANWSELKIEPVNNGTFTSSDGSFSVTIANSNGRYFDWTSNIGVDVVFVKGGTDGNKYSYDEATSDTGLHSPINPSNGQPYGLSHISFCYDLELVVTKTANTSFARTYNWTINKTATPAVIDLFRGDSRSVAYTVEVKKALTPYTDSNWAVSGTITVYNPAATSVQVTGVSDSLAPVSCSVGFPYTLASKASFSCTYSGGLSNGSTRVNTATATTATGSQIGGGSGKADVVFGSPTTEVNKSITVSDNYSGAGGPWTFDGDGSKTYARTFTCDADKGTFNNTATIRYANGGTGPSASASVMVNCHALTVEQILAPSLTRTYGWTIDKSVSPATLNMFRGDRSDVRWTISVVRNSGTDSNWRVTGVVKVINNTPIPATINSLSVVIADGIQAQLSNCLPGVPGVLPAGGTLACSFTATLPDGSTRASIATAVLPTTSFSNASSVNFANANVNAVNGTINVDDTNGRTWQFTGTKAQDYTQTFACDSDQGAHENKATISQTGQYDTATATVNCFELTVQKTAIPSANRSYNWTINKTANPTVLNMFRGDSGSTQWTVSVTRDAGTDSDYYVSGLITINNPAPIPATITNVSDLMTGNVTGNVNCGGSSMTIPAGKSLTCAYAASLPDGSTRTNTATATLQNSPSGTTNFSGSAQVDFSNVTPKVTNASVTVTDTNGKSWTFNGSDSQSYSETFSCDANKGPHDNTATIAQTGQTAKSSVTVNCYALTVQKDATPSYTRTYRWNVTKTADQSALTLAMDQQFVVTYTVKVNATVLDSAISVNGNINVTNPAPIPATINSVSDVMTGNIAASVNCGGVGCPYTLAPGATLRCTYSASNLPDATTRSNTATATLQNSPSGTTAFTGSAAVVFGNPTEVDKSASVSDTYAGSFDNVTYGVDTLPKSYVYNRTVGGYATCGNYSVANTATVRGSTTGASATSSWTVNINVPCKGCTLTIGYWKTHAGFGPQHDMVTDYLPIWLGTANGLKSVQVTTAAQAVTVLNKASDASNGINKLYAQLLGAKLNKANGADYSAVSKDIASADAFLALYDASGWSKLNKNLQNQVNSWATALDKYNNGLTGPGHCSQ